MSRCNFCILNSIRQDAARDKKEVTLRPGRNGLGGTDVYVHPFGLDVDQLTKRERNIFWTSWMMEIPDKCAC